MAGECWRHVVGLIRCVTVEPVVFLYMFASSLTFSAYQAMLYDKSCLALYNSSECAELSANKTAARQHGQETDNIQTLASAWMLRGNIAVTVPATVVLLLCLGSWGDRVGRRLPLVVPIVSAILYTVSNILNAVYMHTHLAFMLIGPLCSGLGGSYLAVLMASYTYLTHVADAGSRMTRVGMAEAAVFLSSTVSVFMSGVMVDTLGYVTTFSFVLAFQVVALLYTLTLLPDIKPRGATSTNPNDSATTTITTTTPNTAPTPPTSTEVVTGGRGGCCQGAWCLTSLGDMWQFMRTSRSTRVQVHLTLLIVVLDILQLCTTGELDILLLYLKRSPRNWSYSLYGYFKGAENFTRGAAVLLLLPLLKSRASPRDTSLILAGLLSKMAGLVLLGLANTTWMVFLVMVVACLQGFPSAGLRSLMASLVQKEEQGRLFGLVAATESVVTFTASLMFNGLYPKTLSFYDGFCFQLAAGFVFICFIIVMFQHIDLKTTAMTSFQRLPESPPSGDASDTSSEMASTPSLHPPAAGTSDGGGGGGGAGGFPSYGTADRTQDLTSLPGIGSVQRTENNDQETNFVK